MDPELKSTLTTIFVAICGGGLTAIGITSAHDQMTVANAIIGVVVLGAGAAVTWWKKKQHTPQAQIAAVNDAPNGLKVVKETVTAPKETEPVTAAPTFQRPPRAFIFLAGLTLGKIGTVLALALSLSACAGLGVVASSSVNPNYAAAAVQAFNAAETAADTYLQLPKCTSATGVVCRNATAVKSIVPLIRTGQTARNAILSALQASNGAAIPVASYNTLQAIISTLNSVYTNYGVGTGN